MNKQELIERTSDKTGMTRKDCAIALEGLLAVVTEALTTGEAVKLSGFGSFEVKRRAPRAGRDLRTMEAVEIPAQTVPVFRAGKGLKDSVAGHGGK